MTNLLHPSLIWLYAAFIAFMLYGCLTAEWEENEPKE